MTPGGIVTAALRDGLFPDGARSLGRGWVVWVEGDLEYRVVVDRDGTHMRRRAFLGDARLGPAMERYGRLSVPLDPALADPVWPQGSRLGPDHAAALQRLCRDARSFAHSRRELALLMMSPEDVRRGELVAWLPSGGWPGRLAQALVIATDLDDQPLAGEIRGLIGSRATRVVSRRPRHAPDVTQAERDRLDALYLDRGDLEQDVVRQVEHWLAQYSRALGRTITL
ncbi:hypothetical protein AB0J72_53445 [Dactylosporangium sp. NPDC049742]|uniref:hypothetical protein n=1 Tax=Dactylosporangium sp. NPDC049742 TaxID=3154737 RepID=UPI00342D56E4